jgi:hypothetical protein
VPVATQLIVQSYQHQDLLCNGWYEYISNSCRYIQNKYTYINQVLGYESNIYLKRHQLIVQSYKYQDLLRNGWYEYISISYRCIQNIYTHINRWLHILVHESNIYLKYHQLIVQSNQYQGSRRNG